MSTDTTTEDKIQAEIEKAKDTKISELKMKLMAKGVLTTTFVEKSEIVRAYAEAVVKESESGSGNRMGGGISGLTGGLGNNQEEEVEEEDEEAPITAGLPRYVKRRVQKLKEIHDEREDLMKNYLEERALLEQKYERLSRPLFDKRKTVIEGGMDAQIDAGASASNKDNDDDGENNGNGVGVDNNNNDNEEREIGIPRFWACAIHQMPVTEGLVSETDIECLGSLKDIRCVGHDNGEGFKLEFEFRPNDYFENTVLTKSYDVPNLLLADEPILKNVEGCEIRWKTGRCLTHKEIKKQQRGKGKNAGQVRTIVTKTTTKLESFFHFFTPPKMPSLEAASEEEVMNLEQAFDEDYDVAQAFRSHIIPKAVMWFSGDAMEQEMEAALEGMTWPSEEQGGETTTTTATTTTSSSTSTTTETASS